MKKTLLLLQLLILPCSLLWAQGGMWPVYELQKRAADMKKQGLKIPVSQLYNESQPAYNDAVVLFGSGCTAEIVSKNGLLFTNHHCGYGTAQGLSSNDNNILLNGFWAMNFKEELPCPGLQVHIVKKSIDVTTTILSGVSEKDDPATRSKKIQANIEKYEASYFKISKKKVIVKSYFDGYQFIANEMETFSDIRLVGFPPNGIGKFGGDTDNWMWPRHTGDFAVFRIYADANNQPAAYSKDNVPYHPKKYFPISTKGVQEGDFSMVYGFPYKTTQYISSFETELIQDVIDPIRINARSAKLAVWDKAMSQNQATFLKYAAKQSSVSNGWKKWQGELRGLELNKVVAKKQEFEAKIQKVIDDGYPEYKGILGKMQSLIEGNKNTVAMNEVIRETVLGIEIIQAAGFLDRLIQLYRNETLSQEDKLKEVERLKQSAERFYKNYEVAVDQKTFDTLMPIYFNAQEYGAVPEEMKRNLYYFNNDFSAWSASLFHYSRLTQYETMKHWFEAGFPGDTLAMQQDPAYQIYHWVMNYRAKNITPKIEKYQQKLSELNRQYAIAQIKSNLHWKNQYPDANQSLRLSYGLVKGIKPFGSNTYSYLTTLDEVMMKTNPDIEEFNTPHKLLELYLNKDYGRWASNGTVPVCFIAQNHTSGGNSGSPVLNGKGELIGINFDRVWDGTMSDLYYDPNFCRNISVDIRYVLFIIEKYGNAGWLLKEMDLK